MKTTKGFKKSQSTQPKAVEEKKKEERMPGSGAARLLGFVGGKEVHNSDNYRSPRGNKRQKVKKGGGRTQGGGSQEKKGTAKLLPGKGGCNGKLKTIAVGETKHRGGESCRIP